MASADDVVLDDEAESLDVVEAVELALLVEGGGGGGRWGRVEDALVLDVEDKL